MSTSTLRYYHATLSFMPNKPMRKMQDVRKSFRIHTSRRRFKQSVRTLLAKLS